MAPPTPYRVFFYVLHSKALCGAREAMCDKLRGLLATSDSFHATVETIDAFEPEDIVKHPGGIGSLVELKNDALQEYPDLAKEVRGMHVNQLSCALKHVATLQRIVQNSRDRGGYHVVLEDDIVFGDEQALRSRLHDVFWNLPSDYDIVFLGLPSPKPGSAGADNERLVRVDGRDLFQVLASPGQFLMPMLPCCESYVVNPAAAARMLPLSKPIRLPANLMLTWLSRKLSLRVYSSVPNIFVDGSKLGVYLSQLDSNNRLIWNEHYLHLEELCKDKDKCRVLLQNPDKLRETQEFIDKIQFKNHPDMLRLLARVQMHLGNYKEAAAIFEQVYKVMVAENCVLNAGSQFLRDYMSLHVHLQQQDDVP